MEAVVFMFCVYVLYNVEFDKIYIGFTSNLSERLKSHNELGTKGWTIKYRPWILVHAEEFETKREAMSREKFLKTGIGRKFIRSEIISKL